MKNWDKICRDIQTPSDSDAEDDLNIMSVQKNAQKVSDILHHALPMLDSSRASGLPRGMNSLASFSDPLKRAIDSSRKPASDLPRKQDEKVNENTSSCSKAQSPEDAPLPETAAGPSSVPGESGQGAVSG